MISPRQAIRLAELARYELGLRVSPALVLRCRDVTSLARALEEEGQQERDGGSPWGISLGDLGHGSQLVNGSFTCKPFGPVVHDVGINPRTTVKSLGHMGYEPQ